MSNNMKNPRNETVQAIDFQAALRHIEVQLRDSEDSETIINRLLKGAAEFYGANRASVVEADWALNIGLLTYEWCADGVEPQKEMLQHMAVEGFPRWHDSLSLNQPIIITDVDALKDVHPDEYQFFSQYGVTSVLAAPFSKRLNQGYIAVDNPTQFRNDPTFLFIISYATTALQKGETAMAAIVQKNKRFCVVYSYIDDSGKRKQKWESFKSMPEAKRRQKEVEYKEQIGTFIVPKCKTLDELLKEYVDLYGKTKWSMSTYNSNTSLIEHYISPKIGNLKIGDINTRVIERYYQSLLKTEAVSSKMKKGGVKMLTAHTVHDIHKILRSCFNQAVKWDMMAKNPASNAMVPKAEYAKRDIWTAETLFQALHLCDDPRLALALNVSFCCSLRIGEMLGLTWDCVDISEDSIESGTASVYVNKELQRVSRKTLSALDGKDVMLEFPATTSVTSTVLVLKSPKTESSVRKVFLPKAVAHMLAEWKQTQDEKIELLGSEYQDFNLVFAGALGLPTEASTINAALRRLIKENDLPPVVFHSFRHASITYKLKLNGGDIKAVQGDSGHSQVKMVTDIYSHILDDDRKNNAQLFQEAFYDKKDTKQPTPSFSLPEGISPETLKKMLASPEIAALLEALAKNM